MALINGFGNCNSELIGSAIDKCTPNSYGDLLGIAILAPGTKLTEANLKTKAGWETLVSDGKYFPYNNIYNFDQTTPENEVATSSTGLKRVIRDGKPEYTFTYDGTPCLVKSLQNKKGKVWDIIFFFEKGVLGKLNGDGTFSGFQASYFDVGTLRFQAGTDIQSVAVMVQIDNASDFNSKFGFISYDNLGFNLSQVNGAFEAVLGVTATAGTSLKVKVNSSCNSDVFYAGLDDMAVWKVNGVAPSAVQYNQSTGEYTLTVTTLVAGANVNVQLSGKDLLDNIYRGSGQAVVGA